MYKLKFKDEKGKEWASYSEYLVSKGKKKFDTKLTKDEEKHVAKLVKEVRDMEAGLIPRPVEETKTTKSGKKGWTKKTIVGDTKYTSKYDGRRMTLHEWMTRFGWDKNVQEQVLMVHRRVSLQKYDIFDAVSMELGGKKLARREEIKDVN